MCWWTSKTFFGNDSNLDFETLTIIHCMNSHNAPHEKSHNVLLHDKFLSMSCKPKGSVLGQEKKP